MNKPESRKRIRNRNRRRTPPRRAAAGRRRRSRQRHLETSVNMDELRELIALIQENGFAEFELEREGFRIHVRRDLAVGETAEPRGTELAAAQPVDQVQSQTGTAWQFRPGLQRHPHHPGARAETAASEDQDLYMIPSPIVGTFYRSPSPTADPFVKIGSRWKRRQWFVSSRR